MALREDWGLDFPGAIKYDGLLSGSEEEGDAFPCYLQKHKCHLLTAIVLWFFLIHKFIYFWLRWVFVAAAQALSSCSEQGLLFIVKRGLLIAVASLVAEHGL